MPTSVRTDVHEVEMATVALITLLDHIHTTAESEADVDTLVQAVPCCVEVASQLAALAGRLGTLATSLVDMSSDMSGGAPTQHAAEETMADVAADLRTMRSLLHRVTLVAAPTLEDLRHLPAR